jgi:16S rRNA processing protein RimM
MIKKKKIERIPLSTIIEDINEQDYKVVGVVGRHHGKEGEVKVFSYVDDLELFSEYLSDVITLFQKDTGEIRHLRINNKKYAKENCFYVKFEEINTIEEAESILNYEVYLKNEQFPELDDGYYFFEIINSDVFYNGKKLGKVIDVIQTGSNDVFEVLQDDGSTFLVPVIERYVKSIDKKNKIIEIEKPLWK